MVVGLLCFFGFVWVLYRALNGVFVVFGLRFGFIGCIWWWVNEVSFILYCGMW